MARCPRRRPLRRLTAATYADGNNDWVHPSVIAWHSPCSHSNHHALATNNTTETAQWGSTNDRPRLRPIMTPDRSGVPGSSARKSQASQDHRPASQHIENYLPTRFDHCPAAIVAYCYARPLRRPGIICPEQPSIPGSSPGIATHRASPADTTPEPRKHRQTAAG